MNKKKNTFSYRKILMGYDCTGQSSVACELSLDGISMVRLLSPVVIFGTTNAIGSGININFMLVFHREKKMMADEVFF